ncbi:MAG: tyrosine-type recombinase/integrase, partial [Lachnospiraceae bacterium]|nr:tyrosine-type recombinase/integrase [Lachnospiraceae bacterium]
IKAIFNDNTDELYIHAFRFLILTGLRRGELCALMNSDIVGSIAFVQRAINKSNIMTDGKTENAQRTVALCKRAMDVLEDQKEMLRKRRIISPYVFPSITGEMSNPNNFYEHWHDYKQTLDISCSLHELRHTLISYASANIPEALLKKSAGHSKSMDTGIYIHAVQDESAMISSLIDERFKSIL